MKQFTKAASRTKVKQLPADEFFEAENNFFDFLVTFLHLERLY
jgi:hypothetical protein